MEADPELSECLDELERTKNKVTELADHVRELERQLMDRASATQGVEPNARRPEPGTRGAMTRRCRKTEIRSQRPRGRAMSHDPA